MINFYSESLINKLFRSKVQQLINKDSTLVNSKDKDCTTALSVALKYKNLHTYLILSRF
ncbi:hypothetical protein [Orientia tsutsugamushi]|uniref:Ankyrin n=1 Tax=Orientia tsutsugamushi TaxID=784 RepID=A0A2U3QRY4_ORITS|nr:hypothetical protein [Orientia tsutsugamushi]KJV50504.1 hypothetical protein OTSKATO_1605 [Orientia tsutsugamushi str. Kato PP]SPR03733.1 ankyrin [Orientia tsutsugamushi]